LIIAAAPFRLQAVAAALVPLAQARGAAAIVVNDTRIAGRTRADGVHIDTGLNDLADAVSKLRPAMIVGAGGLRSRDDAMRAGEAEPDYLFFGRLDGDTGDEIFDKALDLAAWWSSVFVIPAIVMGGRTLASVSEAARAGIEFVALRHAVFGDPRGPGKAVAEANRRLAEAAEVVA
jgi:thiamine-phosphate pyrophosphorylase